MGAKQSNQAHDRNNQPGTAIYWRSPARPAGGSGGMDRALDSKAAPVLHRGHFHWGWPIRRGDGLVAGAGTGVDCRDKVSAHHFADDPRKRVTERNARAFAGIEHRRATIAVGDTDELHDCVGDSRVVQSADSVCSLERTAAVGQRAIFRPNLSIYPGDARVHYRFRGDDGQCPPRAITEATQRQSSSRAPRPVRVAGGQFISRKPALLDIASVYWEARSCDSFFQAASASRKFLRNIVPRNTPSAGSRMNAGRMKTPLTPALSHQMWRGRDLAILWRVPESLWRDEILPVHKNLSLR